MENVKVKGRIWIETDYGLRIGKGRTALLEQIDRLGSITEAAKVLRIPYRRAWGIIQDINSASLQKLVIKKAGGKAGGESCLTEYGKNIVEEFKTVEEHFQKFSKDESNRFSRRKKLQDGTR
ncbi:MULTISPECIES: winged helix-turn-helix domain-containing protein [Chryseobacterium]|uniref:winged helix-turn-helix domain-containing protein n=1 Tax=Chryseobacterium TaxID=59732 RepID=UPI000D1297B0|nr:LysR family transcriptional regulator [Chryseobacterium aurantiacum]